MAAFLSWFITGERFEKSHEFEFATLEKLTQFTADRPFQYRLLIPAIGNLTEKIILNMNEMFELKSFYFLTDFVSLLAVWYLFSVFIFLTVSPDKVYSCCLSLGIYLPIYLAFLAPGYNVLYPFDLSQIAFFTGGLILIFRERFLALVILFIFSTLNRETSLFLIIIFILTNYKRDAERIFYFRLFLLSAIWLMEKIILYAMVKGSGDVFLWKVSENIHLFNNLKGIEYLGMYFYINIFLLPVIVFWRRIKNEFIRRTVFVMLPFYLTMFLVGIIFEYRIHAEMIPVSYAAFLSILIKKKKYNTASASFDA